MDQQDELLLNFLARQEKPIEIKEKNVSPEIRTSFQFYGLDKHKFPNSIWVRLHELKTYNLVKEPFVGMWQITEDGKFLLEREKKSNQSTVIDQATILKFFYKQDRDLTIDDLFNKFGNDDRAVLTPINHLVNNDLLEEVSPLIWRITEEGKQEFENHQRVNFGQPIGNITINGTGNIINNGVVEGNINTNIRALNEAGLDQISKSIKDLAEAIKPAIDIQDYQKEEYLETLQLLSEEALKPKDKRLPISTLKQIIQFGLGTLNTFSSVSTIAGITIKDIANYFLS
jgi:hypothetical protein